MSSLFGRKKRGTSGAAFAAVRASARRRTQPLVPELYAKLWMQNGGVTHAQDHMISSPYLIVGAIVLGGVALAAVAVAVLARVGILSVALSWVK
jgi:hypothetical protein